MRQVTFAPTFAGWQLAARTGLREKWSPEELLWQELGTDQPLLDIGDEAETTPRSTSSVRVPRSFVDLATRVACHSDSHRWGLLYRTLWRITHGEHQLMQILVDPDVYRLKQMEKAIRHDMHKMRAFVRFRAVQHEGSTWYVAWFEPDHHIVELNAPFFTDRFANMYWSILTPNRCVHWDQTNVSFSEGVSRTEAPTEDATESLWIKYYSHIFNPARVKTHAMLAEMPKKYWKNLPEAAVISDLLREAPSRVNSMMAKSHAKKVEPS